MRRHRQSAAPKDSVAYMSEPLMTGAELKAAREYLGLSASWLAEFAVCDERRVQRMELDQELVAESVVNAVEKVFDETDEMVTRLTDKYGLLTKNNPGKTITMPVYRSDAEYLKAHKHGRFQARWHRMVAQRVALVVPGLVLAYEKPYRVNQRPWERDKRRQKVSP